MHCMILHYRMIKKLKQKDEKTIELERKEQGFSLYVNGANDKLRKGSRNHPSHPQTSRPKSRKTRTAGGKYYSLELYVLLGHRNLPRCDVSNSITVIVFNC